MLCERPTQPYLLHSGLPAIQLASIVLMASQGSRQQPTLITVAGAGVVGFHGDGGFATAAWLHNPSGIAFDSHNLYIVDTVSLVVIHCSCSHGVNHS